MSIFTYYVVTFYVAERPISTSFVDIKQSVFCSTTTTTVTTTDESAT